MNLQYLAFISETASGNYNDFEACKWRQKQETDFLAAHLDMTKRIDDIRAQKSTMPKELYKSERQKAKLVRQLAWIYTLESNVCAELRNALAAIPATDPDTIYVAALPEFFWRDINDNSKTKQNADGTDYDNYGKPFYGKTVNEFVQPHNDKGDTFTKLTADFPRLIIFAGTFWWKLDAIDSPIKEEKYLNTLMVFHSGDLQYTWNKQWVSDIDGAGKEGSPKRIDIPYNATPKQGSVPLVTFQGVTFGMDICLDFMVGGAPRGAVRARKEGRITEEKLREISHRNAPLSKALIQGARLPCPQVQVLVAGGMPLDGGYLFAQSLLLRCDALPDFDPALPDPGCFAELMDCKVPSGAANPLRALPMPAGSPIFTFAPVAL